MPARIFRTLSGLKRWRESVAADKDDCAIVAGSFRILHPGNLFCVAKASAKFRRLCLVLERGQTRSRELDSTPLLSLLRGVEAIAVLRPGEMGLALRSLRPYVLVDCLSQAANEPARRAALRNAKRVYGIAPLKGCFMKDIRAAISSNHLPLSVPRPKMRLKGGEIRLSKIIAGLKGRKIVTVNGSFDVLHAGHALLLERARRKGDALIVLVNDDQSVRILKGSRRPVFPVESRLAALRSLEPVTAAVPFSGDNPLDALRRLRPAVHVKGGSFVPERVRMEEKLLASWGGRVAFVPMYKKHSTTGVIGALSGRP